MPTLFDRLRSGAGRAAFEADKVRRTTVLQAQERKLKDEAEQSLYQIGVVAYDLYRDQRINEPRLLQACERTAILQQKVKQLEQEIEDIRNEEYSSPPSYANALEGTMTCPNGHGDLPQGARFCPICGEEAVALSPPASAFCPNCGASLNVSGARFCPECGDAVESPRDFTMPSQPSSPTSNEEESLTDETQVVSPTRQGKEEPATAHLETELSKKLPETIKNVPEENENEVVEEFSSGKHCQTCGALMSSDAIFCPECGARISSDESTNSVKSEEGDGWHL